MTDFKPIYDILDSMKPPRALTPDDEVYARGYEDAVAEMLDSVEELDVERNKEDKSSD